MTGLCEPPMRPFRLGSGWELSVTDVICINFVSKWPKNSTMNYNREPRNGDKVVKVKKVVEKCTR